MITDHHYTIPGSADPGSTDDGGHSPDVDTTITTALLLDPTGPGYRLDSKWPGDVRHIAPSYEG